MQKLKDKHEQEKKDIAKQLMTYVNNFSERDLSLAYQMSNRILKSYNVDVSVPSKTEFDNF
jgi:hypothetical protein